MMDDYRKEQEGTLKIFAPPQAAEVPAPVTDVPVAPAAPAAPVQEGTLKIYAQPAVQAPSVVQASAATQTPAFPEAPVESTVKIFESAPSEKVQAAMNLRPTSYPDQLQYFSPRDVRQTISQMRIVYNGQAHHFDRPVSLSIGRSAGNMMVIPDAHVSGQHAVIDCGSSAVTVRNVSAFREGKQNPVYINDRPLEGSSVLRSGDVLKLNCVPLTVTWTVRTNRAPVTPPVPAQTAVPAPTPAAPVQMLQQDAQVTVPILRREEAQQTLTTVRLLVSWKLQHGQEQQRVVWLTEQFPTTVGRSEGDTVFLDDPCRSVSRSHLTLYLQEGAVMLRNSSKGPDGSSGYNPVYLEGSRLTEPVSLKDCLGKRLELGLASLTIRMAD